jgi:hypothetical protein
MAGEPILEQVKRAARQRVLYLAHAIRQMSHPDRMISQRKWNEFFSRVN